MTYALISTRRLKIFRLNRPAAAFLGSVANVIVVESARPQFEVGFWDYARLGIPITLVTTVVGVALLLVMR